MMRFRVMRALAFLAGMIACVDAAAQLEPREFSPPSPTDRDQITVSYSIVTNCQITPRVSLTDNVVRVITELEFCTPVPPFPVPVQATIGRLAAGSYQVEFYRQFVTSGDPPQLLDTTTLVVAASPVPVPTLSEWAEGALAIAMATAAMLLLRRAS